MLFRSEVLANARTCIGQYCKACPVCNGCLLYTSVLHYTGIWTDTLRGGQTQLVNTNKLLRRYNGITGDVYKRQAWWWAWPPVQSLGLPVP